MTNIECEKIVDKLRAAVTEADGLKKCPFCGGDNLESRRCDYGTSVMGKPWLVGCRKCKVYVSICPTEARLKGFRGAQEAAETTWNGRIS